MSIKDAQPLTLYELLDNASHFHPSLKTAQLEARAASEDKDAISLQRWATATLTAESQTGNLRSYPTNVLQVQQTIWDFGRLSARIAEAEATANLGLINVELQRQDLFLQIISAWQNMHASREKVSVAQNTLDRLNAYQVQMRRRVEAEASARIDLELIDARLLQTEVELTTAKTSLQVATMKLEQLSGLSLLYERVDSALPMPSLQETQLFARALNMADWHLIAADSLVVVKARAQLRQAQNKYNAKKSEAWPQLYVRTYKPLSKVPSSTDNTMTAFVGLSYTPGAGLSTLAEAHALSTRINGAEFSIDSALLEMKQTLNADSEEYANARSRIAALEKAVGGSELVLASYKRQFEAGKKTWLDLLNAVRELGQNQYNQADAKATMLGAMYRLQLRMGSLPH